MRFLRNIVSNRNPGRRAADLKVPWSGRIPQPPNPLRHEPHDPDMPRLRPSLFERHLAGISVTDIATLAGKTTRSQ